MREGLVRLGGIVVRQRVEDAWPGQHALRLQGRSSRLEHRPEGFALADHYAAKADKPFTHIVVDEAQDLGVPELRLIDDDMREGLVRLGGIVVRQRVEDAWPGQHALRLQGRSSRLEHRPEGFALATAEAVLAPQPRHIGIGAGMADPPGIDHAGPLSRQEPLRIALQARVARRARQGALNLFSRRDARLPAEGELKQLNRQAFE